ncbi:MAG: hypothetical protein RR500_08445 [Bacilli bacterium]
MKWLKKLQTKCSKWIISFTNRSIVFSCLAIFYEEELPKELEKENPFYES